MTSRSLRTSLVLGLGLVLAVALLSPLAKSQMQAAPSYLPIGVASAGNTSTAWFHEPYSRQVLACQTVSTAAGPSAVQCVSAKLPQ